MRLGRLDHLVLQVPEIESAHARLLGLGFDEAWPIGRTWSYGPTSGIALGGINLELLQPDEDPPESPVVAELVFTPDPRTPLETYGRVVEKIEPDPEKLAARGFPSSMRSRPQRICTNHDGRTSSVITPRSSLNDSRGVLSDCPTALFAILRSALFDPVHASLRCQLIRISRAFSRRLS